MKKNFLSVLLAMFIALSSFVFAPLSAQATPWLENAWDMSDIDLTDWMSGIRGETKLTEITIPGTHDSCASNFTSLIGANIGRCQDKTLSEQLNAGVRFLDIRCSVSVTNDISFSVKTVHSSLTCAKNGSTYYLDNALSDIYSWLDSHPSETVLVCIKKDTDSGTTDEFATGIYQYIHGFGQGKSYYGDDYYYKDYWYLGKTVPTLGEVRGKCVLFNRFHQNLEGSYASADEIESGQKVSWSDQGGSDYFTPSYAYNYNNNTGIGYFCVQDRYQWSVSNKCLAIQEMLDLAHSPGMYYFNFTSSSNQVDSKIPIPKNYASTINANFLTMNFNAEKPSGIIAMDFVNTDVTRKIVMNNQSVANLVKGTDGNISYSLNRMTHTLTISGSGAMKNYGVTGSRGSDYDASTAPWSDQPSGILYDGQYNTDIIEKIVVEEGVTSIGDYAFYHFDNVSEVSLPSTLASVSDTAFLKSSYELPQEPADESVLQAVTAYVDTLSSEDYTKTSFDTLQSVNRQYAAYLDSNRSQEEIDYAVTAVLGALYDLVPYLNLTVKADHGSVLASFQEAGITGESVTSLNRGTNVTLTAQAEEGYEFAGWYETVTSRMVCTEEQYTFPLSSNTSLEARFVKTGSASLMFANESGWIQKIVTKTAKQWQYFTSIKSMLPAVPYQRGYTDGAWDYEDEAVLAKLRNGEDVVILPTYTEIGAAAYPVPEITDHLPTSRLYYEYDEENSTASFVMALALPEAIEVKEMGIAFYYTSPEAFDDNMILTVNNKLLASKFYEKEESGVYVVDITKFSSKYAWAARGYTAYYDADGTLKTAYSNQLNIKNKTIV